jgi:hypothetical protein
MKIEDLIGSISEKYVQEYFRVHFKNYGFTKIKRIPIDGDFIAWKGTRPFRIEIERMTSNFLHHGHDIERINLIAVLWNDQNIFDKEKILQLDAEHFMKWFNATREETIIEERQSIEEIAIDTEIKDIKGELVVKIPTEFYDTFPLKTAIHAKIEKIIRKNEPQKKVF